MTVSEFQKQPRGPYLFDRWLWDKRVSTPLGEFSVELLMLGNDDTHPPDEEILRRASELVRYVEANGEYILDIVFGYYRLAGENDWLDLAGVSRGHTRETVSSLVRDDRTLVVSRHLEWDEPYDSVIHIAPLWDVEHALSLEFHNGQIVSANDSPFRIEDGVFRCQRSSQS
jgi:hypothetical protein